MNFLSSSQLKSKISFFAESWNQFWFSPKNLWGISLFRCLLAFMLFAMYLTRFFDVKLFFFDSGMLTPSELADYVLPMFAPSFNFAPSTNSEVVIYNYAYLVSLLLLGFGLLPRFLTWVALFFHLALLQKNPSIIYGADLIATFWLFYLGFVGHSRYFSVLNYLKKKSVASEKTKHNTSASVLEEMKEALSSMGLRFIQIQLCVTYAFTGWEKLRGSQWWDGSALWTVMGNQQIVPLDLSFFFHFPALVAVMTFATLVFEIYFPMAVWVKPLRKWWLSFGVLMHVGAGVFMGLFYFSFVMLVAYFVFLPRPPQWTNHRVRQ